MLAQIRLWWLQLEVVNCFQLKKHQANLKSEFKKATNIFNANSNKETRRKAPKRYNFIWEMQYFNSHFL